MSEKSHYQWLLVVEGNSDTRLYASLLESAGINSNDFRPYHARGRGQACNAKTWDCIPCDRKKSGQKESDQKRKLLDILKNDLGRDTFRGIILLVDADIGHDFSQYSRSTSLPYSTPNPIMRQDSSNKYWHLDSLDGHRLLPIYGITVPTTGPGCLESDLLAAYDFPVASQPEYLQFERIIQCASEKWGIPKKGDGKQWWEENQKAKMDKFMYAALKQGFDVSRETPSPCPTPPVITVITTIMNTPFP